MSMLNHSFRRTAAVAGCAVLLALGATAVPAGAAPAPPPDPPAPICPAPAGNARFVRYLYIHIMQRCPDAAGMAYWTAQLDSGRARASVSNILDMSTENLVHNNVDGLYGDIMRRAPSVAERAEGVAMIRAERGDAGLIVKLVSSDAFFARVTGADDNAKNSAFVSAIFPEILDRSPDAGALSYYAAMIGSPSTATGRARVVRTLEYSFENSLGWTASSIGAAFNRPPDSGGVQYWSNWLRTTGHWQTFRMWTYLLASPEGYALSQTQPNPPVS